MTGKRVARGAGSQAPISAPPRAEVRPVMHSAHGVSWADEYSWIRADNWREVLRDPSRLPPDIRALLEAENAYSDAVLAPTFGLQKELKREMRARLKEDDSEPPQVDGLWAYYSRFRPGGQRRIYCRKPREGGVETVLIDGDARAEGKAFFHLAGVRHSPDHSKLAWSADDLGSEMLTISVRDLERETDLVDRVFGATGDIVWTRDSQGFLYVEQDESHRPCRVMLHRLGTVQSDDVEIFVEADPAWFIGIEPTRLGRSAPAHRAAPLGVALRGDGSRRSFLYPHQCGRARLQDRRGAARCSAGGKLARFHRRARWTLHCRRNALQASSRAA